MILNVYWLEELLEIVPVNSPTKLSRTFFTINLGKPESILPLNEHESPYLRSRVER